MDDATRVAIEGLRKLKVTQLKDRYRELFGEESPSSNRQHLFRRVAWRLQARAHGMLSERARQRAVEIADDAHRHVMHSTSASGSVVDVSSGCCASSHFEPARAMDMTRQNYAPGN
jgi:hypothetical protein